MAIQTLNVGSGAGAGDGEGLRSSQVKVNSNFAVAENAASKIVQASSADTTADKVMLSDYAWRGAQLGDYFTYGGTANAITLTSANLKAGGTLIAGMKFRFKATTTNTGATTIVVDGGSATACVTPTGVALPAGFIRTDVITECEYDGSSFVVSRKVESGSNANGDWTKWEDGTAVITRNESLGTYTLNKTTSNLGNYDFPISLSDTPAHTCKIGVSSTSAAYVTALYCTIGGVSTTAWNNVSKLALTTQADSAVGVSLTLNAIGKWY